MDTIEIKEGSSSSFDSDDSLETDDRQRSKKKLSRKHRSQIDRTDTVEFVDTKPAEAKPKLSKKELRRKALAKRDSDRIGMVTPDIVRDREKERALLRIATRGVVQLFNAVSQRQKEVDQKLFAGGKKLDKEAKKRAIERLGRSEFEKRLATMNKLKEEEPTSRADDSAMDVGDTSAISTDTSFIKTEPESDDE